MKFETIDDKYLYENIKRFEFNALNINDAVCKHRKFWLISFFIYFANFLLFLSISIFSHGSINSFFVFYEHSVNSRLSPMIFQS